MRPFHIFQVGQCVSRTSIGWNRLKKTMPPLPIKKQIRWNTAIIFNKKSWAKKYLSAKSFDLLFQILIPWSCFQRWKSQKNHVKAIFLHSRNPALCVCDVTQVSHLLFCSSTGCGFKVVRRSKDWVSLLWLPHRARTKQTNQNNPFDPLRVMPALTLTTDIFADEVVLTWFASRVSLPGECTWCFVKESVLQKKALKIFSNNSMHLSETGSCKKFGFVVINLKFWFSFNWTWGCMWIFTLWPFKKIRVTFFDENFKFSDCL